LDKTNLKNWQFVAKRARKSNDHHLMPQESHLDNKKDVIVFIILASDFRPLLVVIFLKPKPETTSHSWLLKTEGEKIKEP